MQRCRFSHDLRQYIICLHAGGYNDGTLVHNYMGDTSQQTFEITHCGASYDSRMDLCRIYGDTAAPRH